MKERHAKARLFVVVSIVSGMLMAFQGCGPSQAKLKNDSSQNMKILGMAIIAFQGENDGKLPDTLDEVKDQAVKEATNMGVDKDFATLMKNPLTGDDPGYEYVKPAEDAPGDSTVILYQLRDGKRDESLPKCYKSASVR